MERLCFSLSSPKRVHVLLIVIVHGARQSGSDSIFYKLILRRKVELNGKIHPVIIIFTVMERLYAVA